MHLFIHTLAVGAGLSWAGSSLLHVVSVGLAHVFLVSWLVPMASLTPLAIGWAIWFSFVWLLSRTGWVSYVTLAASQICTIKFNPLKKYLIPFSG